MNSKVNKIHISEPPRNATLTKNGRTLLIITFTALLIALPLVPVIIAYSLSGHVKTSTLMGLIAIFLGIGSFFSSLIYYNVYLIPKNLLESGIITEAKVSSKEIGGRANGVIVNFQYNDQNYLPFIGKTLLETKSLNIGDPFMIIFDKTKPARAREFPINFWEIISV